MTSLRSVIVLRHISKLSCRALQSTAIPNKYSPSKISHRCFSKSSCLRGIEEFFDASENWNAQEVKCGRAYELEELRIKSNEDLHKLWYVLLKELNMLLTMENACKEDFIIFPNEERIDKVKLSMERLEDAVRERNQAYHMLETGETGELPGGVERDVLGQVEHREYTEHAMPIASNPVAQRYQFVPDPRIEHLHKLIAEKKEFVKEDKKKWEALRIAQIIAEFPHVDLEALAADYPDHDIEEIRNSSLARGNHNYNHN